MNAPKSNGTFFYQKYKTLLDKSNKLDAFVGGVIFVQDFLDIENAFVRARTTHSHARTHARTRARAHTHIHCTHIHIYHFYEIIYDTGLYFAELFTLYAYH